MSDRPTKKQQELLQYIGDFIKENGYGPSYREIMRGCGYKSVSTVAVHVDGLIARGWLRKRTHSARSLEITSPHALHVEAETAKSIEKVLQMKLTELQANDAPDAEQAAIVETMRLLGLDELYGRAKNTLKQPDETGYNKTQDV